MARQVDALRISFSPSVDGQVRLDPGSSGTFHGPAISRSPEMTGEQWRLSSDNNIHRRRSPQVATGRLTGLQTMLQSYYPDPQA
jgi:hypothetical protein